MFVNDGTICIKEKSFLDVYIFFTVYEIKCVLYYERLLKTR